MQITFHGAARTVTGSKHLITTDKGKKILLDCGFFQGQGKDSDAMNRSFHFNPSEIDALILSHAHIDHTGNVPNLVKQGFSGPIYATPATRDLCEIMLADTAHIQESDLRYINKRRAKDDKPPILPIYNLQDVQQALSQFVTVPYKQVFKVNDELEFFYTDAGHILGSTAINLSIKTNSGVKKIFFSGDIGRQQDKILIAPQPFPQADYILCESTYGNRLHPSADETENRLQNIVMETCVKKKGKVIIPAFSLGRTQEIVYVLNTLKNAGKLPPIKVYVDSPLSINATNIMRNHPESFNDEIKKTLHDDPDPFGFSGLIYIRDADESKKLNDLTEPCIIISASGMAEAGRIKHHIKNNISDKKNTILIVGYCQPESLGGRLASKQKRVRIFGEEYKVIANVEVMNSYSAHGDYNEMLHYLSCQDKSKVKKVFLVHGEYKVQKDWREKLMQSGFQHIEIPEMDSVWEI